MFPSCAQAAGGPHDDDRRADTGIGAVLTVDARWWFNWPQTAEFLRETSDDRFRGRRRAASAIRERPLWAALHVGRPTSSFASLRNIAGSEAALSLAGRPKPSTGGSWQSALAHLALHLP